MSSSLLTTHRGMNRNLLILGTLALLVLGGLAAFIATRKGGNIFNTKNNINNEIIHNSYFQDLIVSGKATARGLEAMAIIRPLGDGFVGLTLDTYSESGAKECARNVGARVLALENNPTGSREEIARSVAVIIPPQLAGPAWVEVNGNLQVLSASKTEAGGNVINRFRILLYWRGAPSSAAVVNRLGMGLCQIPAGTFLMGDVTSDGTDVEKPVHSVQLGAYLIAAHETTGNEWDKVRSWGVGNGYNDLPVGAGKAPDHPVFNVSWYDVVKWCNACSESEGLQPCYTLGGAAYRTGSASEVACDWKALGYRLPTEAEWEKAARGGLSGKRFPWGDTIDHSLANYRSNPAICRYDTSNCAPWAYHPDYKQGGSPYTAPVQSFSANGYGLFDMAGNLWEWCWDWYGPYDAGSQEDPRGPHAGTKRVFRGGSWLTRGAYCRVSMRDNTNETDKRNHFLGFRVARSGYEPQPGRLSEDRSRNP